MAIVIHNIKGNDYAYDHNRVGDKVVSTYVGRSGGNGAIYKGTELYKPEVTQQENKIIKEAIKSLEKTDSLKEAGKITQQEHDVRSKEAIQKVVEKAEVTQHEKDQSELKKVKKELTDFNKEYKKGDSGIITRIRRGREIDIRKRLAWAKEAEEKSRPKPHIETFAEAASKPTGQIYEPIRDKYGRVIGTRLKEEVTQHKR